MVELIGLVVAGDAYDFEAGEVALACHSEAAFRRGRGVRRTHVRHDARGSLGFGAQVDEGVEDAREAVIEQVIVAKLGILAAPGLGDGDCALREALEDDVVEVTAADEVDGGFDTVATVSRARADADSSHVWRPFALRAKGGWEYWPASRECAGTT